jgi:hypothetical protein
MAPFHPVTIPVFIGYDPRQPVAFTALVQSIVSQCSMPVAIHPLVIEALPVKRQGLTPFTFSRFLMPYLQDWKGWALFLDIDMIVNGDLAELWSLRDLSKAAMVVKTSLKFERASMMLLNCDRCGILTPEYVEKADNLHSLSWLKDDLVGELPPEWNYLVGYDDPDKAKDAKLIHYTQGIPAFPETKDGGLADIWSKHAQRALSTVPWQVLMGNSVHAKPVMDRLNQQKEVA